MRIHRTANFSENVRQRRGIALVLVLLVMAVASILAFAMLSAGALQATAGSNAVTAAAAEAQAESGIHLASYYLANQNVAPVTWQSVPITFASMPGSVTVTVAAGAQNYYTVTSIGSVPTSTDGQSITRTITAEIEVIPSCQINGAGVFNANNLTIGSGVTVTGPVSSSGTVSTSGTGSITPAPGAPTSTPPAPATGSVTDYSQPYYYQGTLYNPGTVSGTGGIFGPTTSNPLGIYYYSNSGGNLTVNSPLTVTGTLYVKGGTLIDKSNITINPVIIAGLTSSLPALVVDQAIQMKANATLTATGVVCTNLGITNVGANSSTQVTITGALLITGATGGITNGLAKVKIIYSSANTNDINLVATPPPAVKVISWSE
jgi:hypothetical protein